MSVPRIGEDARLKYMKDNAFMIIGIDARFAVRNRRGIGNYTLKLIQNLAEIDIKNEYILYIDIDDSNNILRKNYNFKMLHSTSKCNV